MAPERRVWSETLPAGSRVLGSPYKARRDLTLDVLEWDGAYAGVHITMSYDVPGQPDQEGKPTVQTQRVAYTFPPALEEEDVGLDVVSVLSRLWHEHDALAHKQAPSKEDGKRLKDLSVLLEAA